MIMAFLDILHIQVLKILRLLLSNADFRCEKKKKSVLPNFGRYSDYLLFICLRLLYSSAKMLI